MKIKEMLGSIISASISRGTFVTSDLIKQAKAANVTGIAAAKEEDRELYLALIEGETEGAIMIDEKGELFGDKAVMMMKGKEQFSLYDVDKEIVDAVVMGCRVFDKSLIRATTSYDIPEFGMKSSGIGNLTLFIRHNNEPQNGVRVSIRKDGKIVGSDTTTGEGSVGFRVMYADYDIVLQDRNQMITTRRITFSESVPKIILEL